MEIKTLNQAQRSFTCEEDAVLYLQKLYTDSKTFLTESFRKFAKSETLNCRYRAFYPEIRISVASHVRVDSRLSFGHVPYPGEFSTTVSRPDLFEYYLKSQMQLLRESHNVPLQIGPSDTPMPVHFALPDEGMSSIDEEKMRLLRDYFDVPSLENTHDEIVNGENWTYPDGSRPLSSFTAQRTDYSLARLTHYTATKPEHFQNFILFTNYQFYMDEFERYAKSVIKDPNSGYTSYVVSGNAELTSEGWKGERAARTPQMPTFHLKRKHGQGITLVNIGVGPSNAKTITDHIAVLRPFAWIMVGHCAGLRNSQRLGDYVLAHAYMREDSVLDDDIPTWVPLPALSEVQMALEQAVAEITNYDGYDLKRIMRTGTVASVDNRNWELRDNSGPVKRLNQARAVALDMESATIAANGFRFRVPYGTLLCVSDKPLHGELKLPGMASDFYKKQVEQHLLIGIRAMEKLRAMPISQLHSRKLRSFDETAFL